MNSDLRPKIGLTLVVIVLMTIILNAVNFLLCFFRDIYRGLRSLYYKILFWCERLMKKSKVVKMLPFHKEEEKKKLPHPADTKCMINDKQYFVSTLDTVVNTDLNLKLKKNKVIKVNKPLDEGFEPDVSDMIARLPKPLELKVPERPPIPEMPEDLELRLAAGLYLKPKSVQFWNKSRGIKGEVEGEKQEED
jgi:hypothetical protein